MFLKRKFLIKQKHLFFFFSQAAMVPFFPQRNKTPHALRERVIHKISSRKIAAIINQGDREAAQYKVKFFDKAVDIFSLDMEVRYLLVSRRR